MKPTAQQPRFYKFRKYQIPQYIKDALDALKPPEVARRRGLSNLKN